MNTICVHIDIFFRPIISHRFLFFSLILMFTMIGSYYYLRTERDMTLNPILIHSNRNQFGMNMKSSISVSNSWNSCPKSFRIRQPEFLWPPQPICDVQCAVNGLEEVLPSIPWFYQYYQQFFNSTEKAKDVKWFNLSRFLRVTITRLRTLGLLPVKKRQLFLDIGTGFGYLPFLANHFNHCSIGIDSYSNITQRFSRFFPQMTNTLGIDLRQQRILPMKSIERNLFDGIRFDVISAYLAWFHCLPQMWTLNEWIFFITDLAEHHTRENAFIYLNLNRCRYKNQTSIEYLWNNQTMNILKSKGVRFIQGQGSPTTMKIKHLRAFRKTSMTID